MSTQIGSFRVRAAVGEIDAFRKATGLVGESKILPLTYPIRWLVTPDIRAALVAMVPEPDLVLVHEAQMFDYQRPLEPNQDYTLTLTARREPSPDRLFVDGTITSTDGSTCATVETVLRLFSTDLAAA